MLIAALLLFYGSRLCFALPQNPIASYPLQAGMAIPQYPQAQSQAIPMQYYQPPSANPPVMSTSGGQPLAFNQAPAAGPGPVPVSYQQSQPQWQISSFGQQTPQQYPTFYPPGQSFGQLSSQKYVQGQSYIPTMLQAGILSSGMNTQLSAISQNGSPTIQSNPLSMQGIQTFPNAQGLQPQGPQMQYPSIPNAQGSLLQGAQQNPATTGQAQSSQQSSISRGNPWAPVLPQQLVNGGIPAILPPVQPFPGQAGPPNQGNKAPPPPPWLKSPASPAAAPAPPKQQIPPPAPGIPLLQQEVLPKGVTQVPTIESRAQTTEAMLYDGSQVQSFTDGLTAQFKNRNGCLDPAKSGSLSLVDYVITRRELSMYQLGKDQLSTNIHCQHGEVATNPQYVLLPNNIKPNIVDPVTQIIFTSGVGRCPTSLLRSSNNIIAIEPVLIGPWGQSSLGIMNLPEHCGQVTNLLPFNLTEAIAKQSNEQDQIQQMTKAENLPVQSGPPQPKM